MARWTSAAATAESTPPDSPQTARPSPICLAMACVCSSITPRMVHVGWQPAAARNWRSICVPCSVCSTSGWNCIPYSCRAGSSAAATGVPAVCAVTANPGGAAAHVSPCDIHTWSCSGSPPRSTPPSGTARAVAPYSPPPVRETVPPRPLTMSWKP
jgi:hypothetical protein